MIRKTLLLFLVAFITGIFSCAQDEEGIDLTPGDLDRFLGSFNEIRAHFEKLDVVYNDEDHDFIAPDRPETLLELDKIVQKHGYENYSDFVGKTTVILLTYSALYMYEQTESVNPEFQKAIEEIEKNPALTPEQKQEMINVLKQSFAAINDAGKELTNSKNAAVVKPHMKAIEEMLRDE